MSEIVYKILTEDQLTSFIKSGKFDGTDLDKKDGYIHMSSNQEQIKRVRNKYYSDHPTVWLLHIDVTKLDNLKYEPISSGDIYPHQYGKLYLDNVVKTEQI